MSKPMVAVCMPVRDQLHLATFRSFARLDLPRPFHLFDKTDAPVDAARNVIVANILRDFPDVTHLLWIDDDMVFDPDAAQRLLAHDLPIVGGLCHNRRPPYMPILMKKPKADGPGYAFIYDYADGLVEVDATGAAFLLVKREVYEKIQPTLAPGEGPFSLCGAGEDVSFCERARAVGYNIYVDTTVQIGHVGEVVVTDAFARRNRDAFILPYLDPSRPQALHDIAKVTKDGLRICGAESDDEARRHRARYSWAARKLADIFQTAQVVDYGCGAGYGCALMTREALQRGAALACVGFEPDADAVKFGREVWWPSLFTSEEEAFRDRPVGAITCFEVMEHIPERRPRETLLRLLDAAPIVLGSVPYMEPAGRNPHHVHALLGMSEFDGLDGVEFEFFGQKMDSTIAPMQFGDCDVALMLFAARRAP